MAKARAVFRCQQCAAESAKWLGRCLECGEWGTVVEEREVASREGARILRDVPDQPVSIADVSVDRLEFRPTGVAELDRVLGGGLAPASVTLLGGEPGIGKSTLMLQALCQMAHTRTRCLLATAEESKYQVRRRAERLGALPPELWLVAETSLPALIDHALTLRPEVLVVDSIQMVFDPQTPGAPGSVSQVRDGAQQLVQVAKGTGITTLMIGHVTKEGTLAGPRVLEHIVDTVLSFEGERHHSLRLLRALKHRFGSTQELGLFEMSQDGLHDVVDPSALFLADRREGSPGSVVAAVLEGARPLLVEVQALVAPTNATMPRRSAQGIDGGRLALLLGVLERRARLRFADADVYASVAGGVRVVETGIDLACCLALASALTDRPVLPDVVAIGEVGLGGEIRQAAQTPRRLSEAARVGFRRAIVSAVTPDVPGIDLSRVQDLREALATAGIQ